MFPRLQPLFDFVSQPTQWIHCVSVNGVYKSRFENYPPTYSSLGSDVNACVLSPRGLSVNPSLAVKTSFSYTPEHVVLDSVETLNNSLDSIKE